MKKITSVLSIILLLALCAGSYCYAEPINKWYFANHPMTVQEIIDEYGKPDGIQKLADGTQKFVYNISENALDIKSVFFIVKDGNIIDHELGLQPWQGLTMQQQLDALKSIVGDIGKRMKVLERKTGK